MIVFPLAVGCIDAYFWLKFTGYFLTERHKKRDMNLLMTIAGILFSALSIARIFLGEKNVAIWYSYFTMIVTVVLTFRGYVNNKKERMFYWFLYRMVFVTMDIVSIAIIDKFAIEEDSVNYWGLIVFSRVLMLAVVSFLKSKRPRQPDLKRDDLMVLVVIYGFCSLIMELIHFSLMTHLNNLNLVIEQYVFLGLVYVFVFGIGVALYYAVWLKSIEDVEERLMIQQMVLERQWKKDIEEETKKLRILRHDMNNHIAVLKLLSDTGQEEELKEYIEEMYHKIERANDVVVTESTTLASLVSTKKMKAKELGIKFDSKLILKELKLSDMDISTLFGNLLDNAMEAAQKADKKWIDLMVEEKNDYFMVVCENSYKDAPKKKGGEFVTSKEDEDSHGMGIKSMKQIVEKYKGEIKISFENNVFTVKIRFNK